MFDKIFSSGFEDYELIDAGGGKKLERFGENIIIRPDIQSYFHTSIPFTDWKKVAHAEYIEKNKKWAFYKKCNGEWKIKVDFIEVLLKFTSYKHIGIFPEQYENWIFIKENLKNDDKFLNLFAYTGVSSLIASKITSEVIHVDSVKNLIDWAKENGELNNLSNIKWVIDDALTFAQREVKREKKYDFIWMDPPAFGNGKNGKKWILDQKIEELIKTASLLLSKNGKIIINTYSPKLNLLELKNLCKKYFNKKNIEVFELWQKTKANKELFYGNCVRIK